MGFGSKNSPTTEASKGPTDSVGKARTTNLRRRLEMVDTELGELASSTKGISQFQKDYQRKLKDLIKAADKAEEAYSVGGVSKQKHLNPQFKEKLKTLKDIGVFAEESVKAYTAIEKSLKKVTSGNLKGTTTRNNVFSAFHESIDAGLKLLNKDVPKQAKSLSKTLGTLIDTALTKAQPTIFASPTLPTYTKKAPSMVRLEKELIKMRGEREAREAKALAWSQQNFLLKKGSSIRSGGFTSISSLQPTGFFPIPPSRALVPMSTIQAGGIYPNMAGRQFGPKDIATYDKLNASRMRDAYMGMVPPTSRDISRLNRQSSLFNKQYSQAQTAASKAELAALMAEFAVLGGGAGGRGPRRSGMSLDTMISRLSDPELQRRMHLSGMMPYSRFGGAIVGPYGFQPEFFGGGGGPGSNAPAFFHPEAFGGSGGFGGFGTGGAAAAGGFFGGMRGAAKAAIELGIPIALYEGWKWINTKGKQALTEYEPILAAARVTGTGGGVGSFERLFSKTHSIRDLAIDPELAKLGYGSIADIAKTISAGGTPFHAMAGFRVATELAQSPLTGFLSAAQYNSAFGNMQAAGVPEAMSGNYDRLREIYEKSIREGMKGYLPPKTIWENMNKFLQQDIGLGIVPTARSLGQFASFGAMSVNPAIRSGQSMMQARQGWQQFGQNALSNPLLYQIAYTDYFRTTGSTLPTAAGMKKWAESLGMGNVLTPKAYKEAGKMGGLGLFVIMRMLAAGGAEPMGYAGMARKFYARSGMGGGVMSALLAPNFGATRIELEKAGLIRHIKASGGAGGMGSNFSDVLSLDKFAESRRMTEFLANGAGTARGMVSSYKAITLETADATVNAVGNTTIQVNSAVIDVIHEIDKGLHIAGRAVSKALSLGGSAGGPAFMGPYPPTSGIPGSGPGSTGTGAP